MSPLVLLADDSATVRTLARLELETAGYRVVEAEDGQAAVERVREGGVDVVLLDVEMPVLDGYGAVRVLKADPATADVPVVFLTGRSGSEDVVEALRLGGHDYLRKPPEPEELLARVAAAARVKALQDELRRRADEMDRMSRTDHLTGLHNRRHMEEHYRAHLSASSRHGHPLSVLIVDVDHFKRVNDTVGHAAGDTVLLEVARRLRGALRVEDLVGRWGGEEFLVLLPWTGQEAATALAERLRAGLAAEPVEVEGHRLPVTVSIGGATAAGHGPDGDGQDRGEPVQSGDLLALADRNLYAAKDAGRDRVRVGTSAEG